MFYAGDYQPGDIFMATEDGGLTKIANMEWSAYAGSETVGQTSQMLDWNYADDGFEKNKAVCLEELQKNISEMITKSFKEKFDKLDCYNELCTCPEYDEGAEEPKVPGRYKIKHR